MAYFDWNERYRVGIASIDAQHQQLFGLVSEFYEAIRQKQTERAMSDLLNGLVEYARTHFLAEETYFKQYHYPLAANHIARHSEFIDKIMEFQTRLLAKQLLIPLELAEFMKTWLTQHVLGEDQQYAPFLQRHLDKHKIQPPGA